jgi:hypothetical protein
MKLTSELFLLLFYFDGLDSMAFYHSEIIPTQNNTNREKRKQISMPSAGFETTITVFERAKTFLSLDRAAIVIDIYTLLSFLNKEVDLTRSVCSVCVCASPYFNF